MAKKKSLVEQYEQIRVEALKYIRKVLNKRGTNYELIDPAEYEDELSDEVYKLPRVNYVDKYFNYYEFPIIVVNIDNDVLTFQGINISEYDEDKGFGEDDIPTDVLCAIADNIKALENE
jgi:hypothetical protein